MTDLSLVVGVPTFRRLALLDPLLPLLGRELDDLERHLAGAGTRLRARVVVADNDPARSAEPVVTAYDDPRVCYTSEPRPGVSAVRNRLLDEAGDADVLVLIDDDETPRPGWLVALVRTHLDTGAALVAGPVVSELEPGATAYVGAGGFFERAHHRGRPTGSRLERAATNNLLVDLDVVRRRGVRFDEDFGRSGGEDTVFTGTLTRGGAAAVWCAEAVVTDHVPAERLTRDYLLRRTQGLAQTTVLAELRLRGSAFDRTRLRLRVAAREAARLVLGWLTLVLGRLTGSLDRRTRGERSRARATGALLAVAGRRPHLYGDSPAGSGTGPTRRRARVYQSVRSAHLERFHALEPATVYFIDRSYDFEGALLTGLDIVPCASPWDLVRRLRRDGVDDLEINEPLMVPGIKTAMLAMAAVRWASPRTRRGSRTRIVTYAIENSDPFVHLRDKLGRRTPAYRWGARFLLRHVDRLAFGTEMARETYAPYLSRFRGTSTVVPALPTPCLDCVGPDGPAAAERGPVVAFVGAFDERKGIRALLEAWPRVRSEVPGARLLVLGKGPLEDLVRSAADADPSIELTLDPSREAIHAAFARARAATLLSVPWRGWREQVGLPIVEALSHGCEVVTTGQTGLATWLRDHGHQVVPTAPAEPAEAARALVRALATTRGPGDVLASLPARDGRLDADRWMFGTAGAAS